MATFVQIVNGVLRRLREETVTDYDDTEYSTLIGKFVNDAKVQVEDMWPWTALRQDLTFNTSASTTTYAVTSSNERTSIQRVLDTTNNCVLQKASQGFIDRNLNLGTAGTGIPVWYRMKGISSGELQMDLYPTPAGTYTILLPSVVPQAELAASSTSLTIPSQPVELLAWALAVRERGETGGTSASEASETAMQAIRNAIILDQSYVQEEIVWQIH